MKHLKTYKIFESNDNDKYLLNLSSANSIIGSERWITDYSNVSDRIKRDANSWSLYPMMNKITTIPARISRLSNKEIADQIKVRGIRTIRIRQEYDEVCNLLLPQFNKLFGKFKRLPLEKKVEFMAELQAEDYVFCTNSDIIKIIDKKDLEYELDMISSKFQYFLLED